MHKAPSRRWLRYSLRTLFVVVVCSSTTVAWTDDPSPIMQKLQGTWIVVECRLVGRADERDIGKEFRIVGDKIYDPSRKLFGSFTIDPHQQPMHFDVFAPRRSGAYRLFGIVEMGEKSLRIAACAGRRPSFFDDAVYVIELIRKTDANNR